MVLLLAAAGGQTAAPSGAQTTDEDPAPRRSGITERTGISLQLLDVEVLDEKGRPPGR